MILRIDILMISVLSATEYEKWQLIGDVLLRDIIWKMNNKFYMYDKASGAMRDKNNEKYNDDFSLYLKDDKYDTIIKIRMGVTSKIDIYKIKYEGLCFNAEWSGTSSSSDFVFTSRTEQDCTEKTFKLRLGTQVSATVLFSIWNFTSRSNDNNEWINDIYRRHVVVESYPRGQFILINAPQNYASIIKLSNFFSKFDGSGFIKSKVYIIEENKLYIEIPAAKNLSEVVLELLKHKIYKVESKHYIFDTNAQQLINIEAGNSVTSVKLNYEYKNGDQTTKIVIEVLNGNTFQIVLRIKEREKILCYSLRNPLSFGSTDVNFRVADDESMCSAFTGYVDLKSGNSLFQTFYESIKDASIDNIDVFYYDDLETPVTINSDTYSISINSSVYTLFPRSSTGASNGRFRVSRQNTIKDLKEWFNDKMINLGNNYYYAHKNSIRNLKGELLTDTISLRSEGSNTKLLIHGNFSFSFEGIKIVGLDKCYTGEWCEKYFIFREINPNMCSYNPLTMVAPRDDNDGIRLIKQFLKDRTWTNPQYKIYNRSYEIIKGGDYEFSDNNFQYIFDSKELKYNTVSAYIKFNDLQSINRSAAESTKDSSADKSTKDNSADESAKDSSSTIIDIFKYIGIALGCLFVVGLVLGLIKFCMMRT